ncbi:BA75_04085T0 [Komagataella pastoris]|uniref:FACT complex subunit n=1 Tax=Komagataella pastoris TaxID=4922 RepID=A0A1B2JEW5_PICPA|nr:BA75_04085T0 [Komagataella pastoris]
MSEVKIDPVAFKNRLGAIQRKLNSSNEIFQGITTLLVVVGSSDESNPYKKSTILHNWLLGYEFPATALAITKNSVTFLTSVGKAKYLTPLQNVTTMKILARNKDPEHNEALFDQFIDQLKSSVDDSKRLGIITKDKFTGTFYQDWLKKWDTAKSDFELVDVATGLSQATEYKDEEEQKFIRTASKATVNMMTVFTDEVINIIDEDLNFTNNQVVDKIENKIDDTKFWKTLEQNKSMKKLGSDFEIGQLDWCYRPIVQSGGKYELKFSAESNDDKLTSGVILASLGLRYNSYCSNVSRTLLIDPSREINKNYDFLLELRSYIMNQIKDGAVCKDVYAKALAMVTKDRPDLAKHFVKNIGSLIGLEFRDSTMVLNAKNDRVIHDGSVINLVLGFQQLKDDSQPLGTYSLLIADTVRITGGEPILLTDSPISRSEISFYFKDEEGEDRKPRVKDEPTSRKIEKPEVSAPARGSKILKSKLRNETTNTEEEKERLRKEIQKQLHEKIQKEGLARFNKSDAQDGNENHAVFKRYESYVRESQIPSKVKNLRISIDPKAQTIILPICGRPVPFHINSFKNGSKNEEGDYMYIRLNFNSPGMGSSVKKIELPYEDGDDKEFVRSLTFRSINKERMSEVFKGITELKKTAVKRDQERKTMEDVVAQAQLVEFKGRPKKLENVFVRPAPDSKRVTGTLFIHQNGIRYQSPVRSDHRVDILFSNIKHLFFQPCKEELMVIIHCHLKTPLMIGKKKTFDVQFYREVSDVTVDETGNKKRRYRYGDEDELEQEQEERRRKALLDKEFRRFAEEISEASNGLLDLETPFRELGFTGVPFRSSVLCLPTRDCLIQLIDTPFLVVTLEEIEVAHLERVQFGLKNFDLVFVFKDFSKPVVHINTIPIEMLEFVKQWLTDVDIPYSEGAVNLNWGTIMKTIQADPYEFFENGGWSFLGGGESDDEESEEEESEFQVSDEDPEDEDVSEEYSAAEDGSDFSEEDDSEGSIAGSEDVSEDEFSD